MIIREYIPEDCFETAELFYNTVHTVNSADYTKEQLNVWAPNKIDLEKWNNNFLEHYSLVALDNNIIIGFGDIDKTGYLDRLYVHREYQKIGVASALCDKLERSVEGKITTHSSITAKSFFEKRGYITIKKQTVNRQGIILINYIMEKSR